MMAHFRSPDFFLLHIQILVSLYLCVCVCVWVRAWVSLWIYHNALYLPLPPPPPAPLHLQQCRPETRQNTTKFRAMTAIRAITVVIDKL